MATVQWENVDFRWRRITIRDKVDGTRAIPLTPYVSQLIAALPRRGPWVFSSPTAKSGHVTEPRYAHDQAMVVAKIDDLTLHGLRRSFGTLAEWVECPAGVVAQIMGHKPSATAEKHYRQRPLDLLRMWHNRIEAWMLNEAKIHFVPKTSAELQLVQA
jgi:integrase